MKIETDYYKMTPSQNTLYIRTFNAWDEKVVADYVSDIRSIAVAQFMTTPWAMLVDRRSWGLSTPEAGKLYAAVASGQFKTPLCHAAVVTGSSELKKWIIENIGKKAESVKVACFENLNDAVAWLTSFGYQMPALDSDESDAG